MLTQICTNTLIPQENFWKDLKSGRFASMIKESSKGQALSNSNEVYNVLKPLFSEQDDVETLYAIFFDAKNKIIAIHKLFSGSITSSAIYTREIIKQVIELKSVAIAIAHNHPSGDIQPSPDDKIITIKIGMALASIDVSLHDHLIIGDGYFSMADNGWIHDIKRKFNQHLKS